MAVMSSLIAAVDRPGRAARAAAAHFRRPAERVAGQPGRPPPQVSFAEARAAGLPPVTVAYERQGVGEPLVLLHGLGHTRQAWHSVLPLLVDGRDAIALDLPGFGLSPDLDPAIPREPGTAVSFLGAFFREWGMDRPHVVGHSLGGLIALRLGQAGLVRSVTTLAPAGFWTGAERRYAYAVLTAARHGVRLLPEGTPAGPAGSTARRAASSDTPYGRSDDCSEDTAVAAFRTMADSTAFTATLRAGRERGLFTGDIPGVPVTVAWGTHDCLLPPWQAARVKAMIPGARIVPLPGCGHVPMDDDPVLVAEMIREATGPVRV